LSLDTLEFYALSGVDYLLQDEPVDYYNQIETSPIAKSVVLPFQAKAPIDTAQEAVNLAASCSTLEELREAMQGFQGSALKAQAKNLVFGMGQLNPEFMFISDVPMAEDDASGLPFQGEAGALFDKMLAAIGLNREEHYLTQLSPWRAGGGVMPKLHDVQALLPFIKRHIELVSPKKLVLMGQMPLQALLNTQDSILKARGKWHDYNGIKVMPVFTPAHLLRQPLHKKLAYADLITLL
jgi:uracil-DNA glycosylase